jgi:hypothetical protein
VKQITFIFILLGYIFSFTELRELLKLPVLMEHYSEHHSVDNSITFTEFLSMHYLQNQDNDGDDEQDRNLPFKSCHNTHSNSSLISHYQDVAIIPIETTIYKNYYSSQDLFLTNFHPTIWQPPKL